ncbi:hypothetical protein, partial [Shimia thalassica]|uniref:hypothetical protein n=1 Tax=Shimia thalassica TaxID=1715693 RepID=UPI0026E190B7
APANSVFTGVRIYRSAGNDFGTATMVEGLNALDPSAAFTVHAGDETTVNILADGDLDNPSAWTIGSEWTMTGSIAEKAVANSGAGYTAREVSQVVPVTAGALHRYSITTASRVSSGVVVYIDGDTRKRGDTFGGVGTDFGTFNAPDDTTGADVGFLGWTGHVGEVDSVAIFEQTADHLAQGEAYFWVVPVTTTGAEGQPNGPHQLTII